MKKWLISVVVVVGAIFLFTNSIVTTTNKGANSIGSGSFTDSQVDTVKWVRESGVVGLAFAASYNDTVEVTTARVLRVVNGKPVNQGACAIGDTLVMLTALDQTTSSAIAAGITTTDYVNLGGLYYQNGTTFSATALGHYGLADEYWVIVQYNSSGNAAVGGTVRYEFIKQYGK